MSKASKTGQVDPKLGQLGLCLEDKRGNKDSSLRSNGNGIKAEDGQEWNNGDGKNSEKDKQTINISIRETMEMERIQKKETKKLNLKSDADVKNTFRSACLASGR